MTEEVLSEKQLKELRDSLTNEMEARKKVLDDLFKKINSNKSIGDRIKNERDSLNFRVKSLSQESKCMKELRDGINKIIKIQKKAQSKFTKQKKTLVDEIKKFKIKRTGYNKESGLPLEKIEKILEEDEKKLLNDDMPLETEIKLFDKVLDFKKRFESAQKANDYHNKIQDNYNKSQKLQSKINLIFEKVQKNANNSQDCHETLGLIHENLGKFRKESDSAHKQLLTIYKENKEIIKGIEAGKEAINKIQTELGAVHKKLKSMSDSRQTERKKTDVKSAKAQLKGSKKMGFDQFRLLMEEGELKFDD